MPKLRLIQVASMLLILSTALGSVSLNPAEARRGGSFGSRGSRTFQAPASTTTAPYTAPVKRSMTPNTVQPSSPSQPSLAQPRPSFWSRFGGGLVGGLVGGLIFNGIFGMLFGHGFGGIGGGLSFVIQLLLIGGVVMLAMRFFSRNNVVPAEAKRPGLSFGQQDFGTGAQAYSPPAATTTATTGEATDEIGITDTDRSAFQRILADMQAAFTREDHQGLRRLTTPEMVSYLSEELADNATKGLKNEVSNLQFLNGEVSEAWREGTRDYATVAMHWSAIDVMRNRHTGAIENGDPNNPVDTTELWTFTREAGQRWLLSAIQETAN